MIEQNNKSHSFVIIVARSIDNYSLYRREITKYWVKLMKQHSERMKKHYTIAKDHLMIYYKWIWCKKRHLLINEEE